ncbi:hypothetical protein JOC76_002016 [Neobacillus cucumis]|nr:hypothetical protein [Neobacillus cucumis]MBM7652558.1 hypothetical protein [Neobacillus cucumis]
MTKSKARGKCFILKNTTTVVGSKVKFYEKLAQKTKKEMDKEWFGR